MDQFIGLPARCEYVVAQCHGRELQIAESRYPAGLRIPRHAHRGATLTAVLGGSLDESYGGAARECGDAVIVVRPAGAPHSDAIGNAGVRNLEVDLSPDLLADGDMARWFDGVCHLRDERANSIAAQLARELSIDDDVRQIAAEGLALELVAVTARLAGAPRLRPPAWLSRAHELIHDRFRAPLTIALLASSAGVHPVHFARAFRKQYRMTPWLLIRQLRIRWAADRIRSADEPLASIAAEAGFYDQAHFARVFRATIGVAPSQFRAATKARATRARD